MDSTYRLKGVHTDTFTFTINFEVTYSYIIFIMRGIYYLVGKVNQSNYRSEAPTGDPGSLIK